MKIEHTAIDPDSGSTRTVISGAGATSLTEGQVLRCAAYRFTVAIVERLYQEAGQEPIAVALLSGTYRPVMGMQVFLVSEPLSQEELQSAIRHLLMLPRMLMSMDAAAVETALRGLCGSQSEHALHLGAEMRMAIDALARVAELMSEATMRLPGAFPIEMASKHQEEIAKLLR